nr:leucine-rich repeat-containing protein 72 isoform X2 [Misgurnus anguillicaudatus]
MLLAILSVLFCLEAMSLVSVTQAKTHSAVCSNTPQLQCAPLSMTGRDEWGVEGHFLPSHFKLRQFKTNRAPTTGFRNNLAPPAFSKSDRIPSAGIVLLFLLSFLLGAVQPFMIKRDIDVCQLHLTRRGLSFVPDLSKFSMLRCVWLNNNKIRDICRNSFNCCLTELYLQNNDIISISGALRHLTCLRVLLLHNNQIKCLDETVEELKNMQDLHTLSLYLNPFTQYPEYRQYVLYHLPSVQLLDRKEVKLEERKEAFKIFSTERRRVLDSIAFGRRALPPPAGSKNNNVKKPASQHGARNSCSSDSTEKPSTITPTQKSIVQVRIIDWSGTKMAQWNQVKPRSNRQLTY